VWIVLCAAAAQPGCERARAAGTPETVVKLGGKLAPFERKDSEGRVVKLGEMLKRSKAVVLDFWSTRCPVSEKYEPTLKKLYDNYAARGIIFLAVDANYNEKVEDVEKVRKERGVGYPVLLDMAEGRLAATLGASHTPEAYLLIPDGTLVYHGNLDEIGGALDAVLTGRPVPKPETKAFGCSIKRP
jgi:thiol-disulfide isomerase/thioredoxin